MSVKLSWIGLLVLLLVFTAGCSEPPVEKAEKVFQEAVALMNDGDDQQAITKVTESLAAEETSWAYYLRATLYKKTEQFAKALADCKMGLALEPDHKDLLWLESELEKPAAVRFMGANSDPPSTSK